jgi:hypothetical protein
MKNTSRSHRIKARNAKLRPLSDREAERVRGGDGTPGPNDDCPYDVRTGVPMCPVPSGGGGNGGIWRKLVSWF